MRTRFLAMPAAFLLACTVGAAQVADDIIRQGAGQRREQLNALELQSLDASVLRGLSNWTNGGPITAADLEGKVTLIMTWSSWYPPANRAMPMVQRLATRYADDGLQVLVVHRVPEWEQAVKDFAGKPDNMILAQDDGALRGSLHAAQDPEFYVIDRAGHMRFAAVDNRSLQAAIETAVNETAEEAAALPARLEADAARAESERWQTRELSREFVRVLRGIDDIEFDMPDPSAYQGVRWPEPKDQHMHGGGMMGQQQEDLSGLRGMMNSWTWIGQRPNIQGRVVVIDFWRTWCGPCRRAIPGLEALQQRYRNELAVIGLSGRDRAETLSRLRSFLAGKRLLYFHAWDESNTLMEQLNVTGFPTVVVLSSDGVIRWRGHPSDPEFRRMVDEIIEVDPGVRARRAAHREMLERAENPADR